MTETPAGANIGLMGGLAQGPDGKHVPMLTVAIPGVMNFSFVVPIDGIPELCVQLPKMLFDLAKQATHANMGLVVGEDASTELRKLERSDNGRKH